MNSRRSALSFLILSFAASQASADDINCQGEIGDDQIEGNLKIAAPCTLNGTTVEGNVDLYSGGSLVAIGAEIDGNILADDADFVDLQNTQVDGKVVTDVKAAIRTTTGTKIPEI